MDNSDDREIRAARNQAVFRLPDVEVVVSSHDGYAVVEVIGRGADVADATFRDERATTSDGGA